MTGVWSGSLKGCLQTCPTSLIATLSLNPTLGLFDKTIAKIYLAYNRGSDRKEVGGEKKKIKLPFFSSPPTLPFSFVLNCF